MKRRPNVGFEMLQKFRQTEAYQHEQEEFRRYKDYLRRLTVAGPTFETATFPA